MTRKHNIAVNFSRDCNVDKKAQLIYNIIVKTDDFIAFDKMRRARAPRLSSGFISSFIE